MFECLQIKDTLKKVKTVIFSQTLSFKLKKYSIKLSSLKSVSTWKRKQKNIHLSESKSITNNPSTRSYIYGTSRQTFCFDFLFFVFYSTNCVSGVRGSREDRKYGDGKWMGDKREGKGDRK